MKRLIVTIEGVSANAMAVREVDRAASRDWSNQFRVKKADKHRKHRALTAERKEEKRLRTERNKIIRAAERDAREHEMFMRRLKSLADRESRRAERSQHRVINARYKPGREPNFQAVCPRSLFRRNHTIAEGRTGRAARSAGDGMRNIVLKFASCRGFGRKAAGTRAYIAGEAGRIARYICRLEGLEEVDGAVITNVISPLAVRERTFAIEQIQQVAGFLNALEEIERATGLSHVYQHLILALPFEVGPGGRARALARFCSEFERLNLPYCAALHKPDPGGNQRNFHAHIVLCARPFEFRADYDWSFYPEKFTELTSKGARPYLRERLAEAINAELRVINSPIRYSGVAEAERLGMTPEGKNKGQAQVAKERASNRDDVAVLALLGNLASHVARLRASIDFPPRQTQPVKQEPMINGADVEKAEVGKAFTPNPLEKVLRRKELPEHSAESAEVPTLITPSYDGGMGVPANDREKAALPTVASTPKPVADKGEYSPLSRAESAQNVPDTSRLKLGRRDEVRRSLSIFAQFGVSEEVKVLAAALSQEPQEIALAIHNGNVQIAFRDTGLIQAVKFVAEDPLVDNWLKQLSRRLDFDHAAVPVTWHHASIHPRQQVWPMKADHWAMTYGGVTPGEDGPAYPPLPYRGR